MDPISLATVTSAVVNLALESGKELASDITKDTWTQIKEWLGWDSAPSHEQIAPAIATKLADDSELANRVTALIKDRPSTLATTLVASLRLEKGSITTVYKNTGTINNTNTFT